MSNTRYIYINGKIEQAGRPLIKADSRGLMYGDGCFETFCSYSGRFFKLNDHLKRLQAGLAYLQINYPADLKLKNIETILSRLLHKNKLTARKAIVRMQVWREGGRGYGSSSTGSSFMITVSGHQGAEKKYQLSTVPTKRIPTAALPSKFKFTNGINYIKAANQARQKGADDALMETVQGYISETTVANIFWKKGGTVFTSSTECDILPGITRQMVIDVLKQDMDVRLHEGKFTIGDLKQANEVWICNSVKEIAPVIRVDDVSFSTNSAFIQELRVQFDQCAENELSQEA